MSGNFWDSQRTNCPDGLRNVLLLLRPQVSEKAGKMRIYTHLHFFLQFICHERQRGCVRLDTGS